MNENNVLTVIGRSSFQNTFIDAIEPSLLRFAHCGHVTGESAGPVPFWVTSALKRFHRIREMFQEDVPAELQSAIRAGRIGWILDNSLEGPLHSLKSSSTWHEDIQALGLGEANIVYLSQNVSYPKQYEQFSRCVQGGARLRCGYYHFFHKKMAWRAATMRIRHERKFVAASRKPNDPKAAGFRRFVSLNHRIRHFRLAFLLSLARDCLLHQGHVSFGGMTHENLLLSKRSLPSSAETPVDALGRDPILGGLVEHWDKLRAIDGHIVDEDRIRTHQNGKLRMSDLIYQFGSPVYRDAYFTVVTETEMTETLQRVTEKPLKPILNFSPFVVFGNYGSLKILRRLGFRSFDRFDESYDDIRNPYDRFFAAYAEFRRLLSLSGSDWISLRAELFDTLAHNQDHALNGFLPFLIKEMDAPLVRFLTETSNGLEAGLVQGL